MVDVARSRDRPHRTASLAIRSAVTRSVRWTLSIVHRQPVVAVVQRAHHVIQRGQRQRSGALVEEREVLGVRIPVSEQDVQGDSPEATSPASPGAATACRMSAMRRSDGPPSSSYFVVRRGPGRLAEVLLVDALHRAVRADDPVVALDDDQLAARQSRSSRRSATSRPRCLAMRMQKASFSTVCGYAAISGLRMCVEGVPSTGRPQEPSGIRVRSELLLHPGQRDRAPGRPPLAARSAGSRRARSSSRGAQRLGGGRRRLWGRRILGRLDHDRSGAVAARAPRSIRTCRPAPTPTSRAIDLPRLTLGEQAVEERTNDPLGVAPVRDGQRQRQQRRAQVRTGRAPRPCRSAGVGPGRGRSTATRSP